MPQVPQSTETPPAKLHELSEKDIVRLLNPEHTHAARLEISGKLAQNYQTNMLGSEDAIIAEQIFRLLVRDTELNIRKQLSETLKTSASLPRDIALTMAVDVVEVALPMLESSKVLSEMDLMDLVHATPDTTRHMAIARRDEVSERLATTLLDYNEEAEVAQTLAANKGAKLNERAMQTMIDRHKDLPQVMDSLATRPSLPPTIAEKVIAHVSEQLRVHVAKTYQVGAEVLAEPSLQSREAATLALIRDNISDTEMEKLVQQLITFERLTPSLLIAALSQGYIGFVVVSLATLAQIPIENASTLIRDKGGNGFRALYNKTSMPLEYFATLGDLMPHALKLKDEMMALEGRTFADVLVRHLRNAAKAEKISVEHLVKVVESSGK